jgi:type VI secretion system ImpA family protein
MTPVTSPSHFLSPAASASAALDGFLPISEQEPCGASLEYDAEYAVLLSRMTPRGQAQYGKFVGTPEAPPWAEIERDCRRLLLRTKDINLLVWLCRARARLGQAAGLAQVLAMLSAALQAWSEAIHPQLVIEGQVDPAVRANALAALADPEGLMSDVRDIVVASSTALRLTVRDVERAFATPRPADAPTPQAVSQQLAALRAAAQGDAGAPVNLLARAAHDVRVIDGWSQRQLGDDAPSLQALIRVLDLFVEPDLACDATEGPPLAHGPAQTRDNPKTHRPAHWPGTPLSSDPGTGVVTRENVLSVIRDAREWFEVHEPSSPVAVLLKQAERMVGKRFSQVADAIPLDLLKKWESDEDVVPPGGMPA